MRKYWWLIIAGVVLIIVAAGVAGFALGDIQAVKGISVMRATPHELAEAMKQDRFFSDYRQAHSLSPARSRPLLGTRAISSWRSGPARRTALVRSRRGDVAPHAGETFTVLTVGQAAERLPTGVRLHDCVIP